ncbi:hypothetical protein [Thalassotalea sp. ND16A]|nr:hypothetical protein [Thalassotalea sp. ND16A]KGJ88702.1 hypothetical protein ND16A_2404 [Thalassotalea sp. ND16A]
MNLNLGKDLEDLKADIEIGLKQIEQGQFADLNFEELLRETN